MKVRAPEEDPRLKAQRERAERIAETDVISETQQTLAQEESAFKRRFGSRAAVGGLGLGGAFRSGAVSGGANGFGGFGGATFGGKFNTR